MIVIVDYGMGNLGSIKNMLKRLGVEAKVSSDPFEIESSAKLIIPGVGAFARGMEQLIERKLDGVLRKKALEDRVPILGICLGMQLMTESSEEGDRSGLGWVPAKTVHFTRDAPLSAKGIKIPHIGWNFVDVAKPHPLLKDLPLEPRFYFVHAYKVVCDTKEDALLTTKYGPIEFTAAFAKNNIVGVQFHPEKSHKFGMKLLQNFSTWSALNA